MQDIKEYMELSQSTRQEHLRLDEPCSEIGGASFQFRALLAYYIGTTIPTGKWTNLCHACGNGKCSNVRHLYWGTVQENTADSKRHGTWSSLHDRTIAKYGVEGMKAIAMKAGKASGLTNKKPQEYWEQYRSVFEQVDRTKRGWVAKLSTSTKLSHTQIRRICIRLGLI